MLMLLLASIAWAASEISTAVSELPALSTSTGASAAGTSIITHTSSEAFQTHTSTGGRREALPKVDTGTGGEGQRTATGVQKSTK